MLFILSLQNFRMLLPYHYHHNLWFFLILRIFIPMGWIVQDIYSPVKTYRGRPFIRSISSSLRMIRLSSLRCQTDRPGVSKNRLIIPSGVGEKPALDLWGHPAAWYFIISQQYYRMLLPLPSQPMVFSDSLNLHPIWTDCSGYSPVSVPSPHRCG